MDNAPWKQTSEESSRANTDRGSNDDPVLSPLDINMPTLLGVVEFCARGGNVICRSRKCLLRDTFQASRAFQSGGVKGVKGRERKGVERKRNSWKMAPAASEARTHFPASL